MIQTSPASCLMVSLSMMLSKHKSNGKTSSCLLLQTTLMVRSGRQLSRVTSRHIPEHALLGLP